MPHYVTQADYDDETYYVYSTVVSAAISPEMTRAKMAKWLSENGYETWLMTTEQQRAWVEEEYADAHPGVLETMRRSAEPQPQQYWNGEFWCCRESDGYYVIYGRR